MKLLIRATNWVGDALLALPALRAVRSKFPDASISILARPYVADIYRGQGVSDELIAYAPIAEHRGWSGRNKLIANLRSRHFDVALLLQNAFDAAWLAWRAQIPQRIGYARDARSLLLTKAIPVPKSGEIPAHEKLYYLELVRRAGWLDALPQVDRITLQVSDSARLHAAQVLLDAGSRPHARRIAIGAGASYGSAKCWPPERFAEWANRFLANNDADVILFGTAAEAPVSAVPSLPRQRFWSHARRRRGRFARRRHLRPYRSLRHGSRHPALHHRPAEALLQPLFPPPLSHRSSLHETGHPRHGRSRSQSLANGPPNVARMNPRLSVPPT
jgi:heptosyltransferase-2